MNNTEPIAVFANSRDAAQMNMQPKGMFVIVQGEESIRGCRFSGVITHFDWYKNQRLVDAYELLIFRQPELRAK